MLTLNDVLQMSNSPQVTKVFTPYINLNSFISFMPFETNASLSVKTAIYDGKYAPTVSDGWVPTSTAPGETDGKFETSTANVYFHRKQIKIDSALSRAPDFIGDPLGMQVGIYSDALIRETQIKFFENDIVTGNSNCYDGIIGRFAKASDYGIPSELSVDMGGLDLSMSGMSLTNAEKIMRSIDDVLAPMSQGSYYGGIVAWCNDKMLNAINAAIRKLGAGAGFETTTDAFDRKIASYNGALFVDAGYRYPLRSLSRIITNTQSADGLSQTGSTKTSIYFTKFAQEGGISGWFNRPLDQIYLFQSPQNDSSGIFNKVTIDMGIGLIQSSPLALARLYNITV